jgi:pimeloyl-ACP methyl ester carboxylesterase
MSFSAGMYYFPHGSEDLFRPPVILIHGAGGTHLSWPPQVRRLQDQRLLALDLPGHGKSERVGRQHITEYASDLLAFMDELRLPHAILVGHSMGAGIALTLALDAPSRVLGLGLLGASPQLEVSPDLLRAASLPSTFRAAVHMVTVYSYGPQADARLVELAEQRMAETRHSVFYGDFLACNSFNVMDRVGRVTAPTLLLAGDRDKMTPLRYARFLQEQIVGSRLEVLPGAGHMLMLEQPDIVAALLLEFLNAFPDLPQNKPSSHR